MSLFCIDYAFASSVLSEFFWVLNNHILLISATLVFLDFCALYTDNTNAWTRVLAK